MKHMTMEELNKIIEDAIVRHGFEIGKKDPILGLSTPKTDEVNFSYFSRFTEDTDWEAGRLVKRLTVEASVRKMGGSPTVEELLRTADHIKRAAELMLELQTADLIYIVQI